ncbi:LrgB family protein [Chitinibacter sp. S2-10]|uniref:LrgB family protein n=1 Tax=Chitinibacter sp. S2-10 TaxID=3373597 RepID=UPI0039772EDF
MNWSWNGLTVWHYLTPLFWLGLTLAVYALSEQIFRRSRGLAWAQSLLHPVLLAVLLLIAILQYGGVSYSQYFAGAYPLHLLLGPATVALAVPLYANLPHIRRYFAPLLIALLVGSLVGILSGMLIAYALGLSPQMIVSIAPKSVTTPIAIALAQHAGGNVSLAAGFVILTGICGAVLAAPLFRLLRIDDEIAQGFAMGVAAHGVGTSRALQMSEITGAFAALAMGLNGVLTSLILSLVLSGYFYWLP